MFAIVPARGPQESTRCDCSGYKGPGKECDTCGHTRGNHYGLYDLDGVQSGCYGYAPKNLATIEEARREQPVRVTDEIAGRIWDARRVFGYEKEDYWGRVSPLHRETFVRMVEAAHAAAPKEGEE